MGTYLTRPTLGASVSLKTLRNSLALSSGLFHPVRETKSFKSRQAVKRVV